MSGFLKLAPALAGALVMSASAPALAQTDVDRRVDRIEKEIRELRSILFQGRDTGQPVVVKPAGPDPAVEALQTRSDQSEATLRATSGRLEVLGHDLEELKRQVAADHDVMIELRGVVKALADQIARAAPPAPPPAADAAPPAPGSAAPSTPPADESTAFRAARARLLDGDFAGAASALSAYLQAYPTSARVREADYLLGEAQYGQNQFAEATVAYARSLKDWPKTPWAADATLKLARSLQASNRNEQACAALAEFRRRYSANAAKALKIRAAGTAVAAKCIAE